MTILSMECVVLIALNHCNTSQKAVPSFWTLSLISNDLLTGQDWSALLLCNMCAQARAHFAGRCLTRWLPCLLPAIQWGEGAATGPSGNACVQRVHACCSLPIH